MINKNNLLTAVNVFLQERTTYDEWDCRITKLIGKDELHDVCKETDCDECPFNTSDAANTYTPIAVTRHIKEY